MMTMLITMIILYFWIKYDDEKDRRKACRETERWARQQGEEKEALRRQQEENERRIEELEDELFRLKYKQ